MAHQHGTAARLDAVLVADLAALELYVTSDHDGGLEAVHHTTTGYDRLIDAAAAEQRDRSGECTTAWS